MGDDRLRINCAVLCTVLTTVASIGSVDVHAQGRPDALAVGPVAAEVVEAENRGRIRTNVVGMSVLGGWSVLNIGTGVAGWATADQPWVRNFHLMNAGWNVVNLGIAGLGFGSALAEDPGKYDLGETIRKSEGIGRVLLFNAGLDLAYLAAGAYLALRGDRDDEPRLLGFGRSLMLQGAFLFTFDMALFAAHGLRTLRFWKKLDTN